MPISLPRGAEAIARAGILLCKALERHPLVPATDPDPVRQAAYAAIRASCAALQELVPDRFVDPGQSSSVSTLTDSAGVSTPTRYRQNGGRMTFRMKRGDIITFASVGLTSFDAGTGSFTDTGGTYTTLADYYSALAAKMAKFYFSSMIIGLERIEQTIGGNLTVVSPPGAFPNTAGAGGSSEPPLWVVTTLKIRTAQANRPLVFKLPGAQVALGKGSVTPDSGGDDFQKLVALLQQGHGGPEAYNGQKPSGNALVSTADNAREYRRLTR